MKIDESIHSFFNSYINSLSQFEEKIQRTIVSLGNNLPLSSSVHTQNKEFNDFLASNKVKEIDEKLYNELKKDFGLNSSYDCENDRVERVGDVMPVKETVAITLELATVLLKFANDVRFLSSGPRSGFGELVIPENEPGSSIMPGKVNPTQCESLSMICSQVLGNGNAVNIATASSMFEGNSFLPLVSNNTVRSLVLLSDGIRSFRTKCFEGVDFIMHKVDEEVKNFKI